MKLLSETYKELGIAFTLPIEIKDADGNETYYEDSNGYRYKKEYDADGNETWCKDSDGYETGTPRSQTYDLKTENNALRNDKKRLDWLMSMIGWASTREDIDRMMGDEEDDGDLDRLNQDI